MYDLETKQEPATHKTIVQRTPSRSQCKAGEPAATRTRNGSKTEGGPASALTPSSYDLRTWTWQWRITNEIRRALEMGHDVTFHTLTYAHLPQAYRTKSKAGNRIYMTPEKVSKQHMQLWFKRIRTFIRRSNDKDPNWSFQNDPYFPSVTSTLRYVGVCEYGTEKGRIHWHAITITERSLSRRLWKTLPSLRWPHGHHDIKKITKDAGIAMYVAKYITKQTHGRTLCSFKFGLMPVITLLSIQSYRDLYQVNPIVALRLIRRLCLTHNYPESRLVSSLTSRVRPLTQFKARRNPRLTAMETGENGSGPDSSVNLASTYTLVRSTIDNLNQITGPLRTTFPGLAYFGRSRKRSNGLASFKDTRLHHERNDRLRHDRRLQAKISV